MPERQSARHTAHLIVDTMFSTDTPDHKADLEDDLQRIFRNLAHPNDELLIRIEESP